MGVCGCGGAAADFPVASIVYSSGSDTVITVLQNSVLAAPFRNFYTSDGTVFQTDDGGGGSINQQNNTRLVGRKPGLYLLRLHVGWAVTSFEHAGAIQKDGGSPTVAFSNASSNNRAVYATTTSYNISRGGYDDDDYALNWVEFADLEGWHISLRNGDNVNAHNVNGYTFYAIYLGAMGAPAKVYGR